MIADDKRTAMDPSGIRFGTPAMTTRGMMEGEAAKLAALMIATMKAKDDVTAKAGFQKEVQALCEAFPVPEVMV